MVGAMSGGSSGEEIQQAPPSQSYMYIFVHILCTVCLRVILYRGQQQQQQPMQQQGTVPCARELEDFIKCTQSSNDLKFCEGLNYMFKQCKMDQGITHCIFIATRA